MLTAIKAGLSLLAGLMSWFNNKQLMDAGAAKQRAEIADDQIERLRRANSVRIDGVRDPFDAKRD
jgi:hypothetical protein|tara:strand:- start:204 stop:398 length:195 start_codon:yes stop_codon:yes gene_type:complete